MILATKANTTPRTVRGASGRSGRTSELTEARSQPSAANTTPEL